MDATTHSSARLGRFEDEVRELREVISWDLTRPRGTTTRFGARPGRSRATAEVRAASPDRQNAQAREQA